MPKIQVHTTPRPEPARRLRRNRYLTVIQVHYNAEAECLKETVTDITARQVKIYLLRAEIEHLKQLRLRLEHLHLQREMPAPPPTLQVSTPTTT